MQKVHSFMTSLCAITLMMTAQPVTSQVKKVEFVAHSSVSPQTAVQVKIKVLFPDGETLSYTTGVDGRLEVDIEDCDASVTIEARAIWGDYTKETKACDPIPVEFAMIPTAQAYAISSILRQIGDGSDVTLSDEASTYFTALKTAVESSDTVAAAQAANELQWYLFVNGESQTAFEYGLFAQSAGFEALAASDGFDVILKDVDPSDTLAFDPIREIVVMTPEGKSLLAGAQQELGIVANGTWDSQTFQALDAFRGNDS